MMIAETGANEEGGDKADWILSALGREAPRFSHIRALVWFNAGKSNGDFRINSSAASLGAFRRTVASPTYDATRHTLLTTPATLPGGSVAPEPPDSGYGAPSFLEQLQQKLHGKYLWLAGALAVLALVAAAAVVAALLRRSRRTRAPA